MRLIFTRPPSSIDTRLRRASQGVPAKSDEFSASDTAKSPNFPVASAGRLPMSYPIGSGRGGRWSGSRLKSSEAILRKMARFGEELCCMLDIWGIRLVVPDIDSLESAAPLVLTHWADVPERQLMLRGGEMRFAPVRDYRTQDHLGRSGATSLSYDQAVHVNRRAPFGVVEIQVMTHDLFLRAFQAQGLDESHRRFAQRRTRALRKPG